MHAVSEAQDRSGSEDDAGRDWHIPPGVLLESAPNTWLLVDSSGTVRMANRAVTRWFGYDPAELVGRPIELLLPSSLGSVHLAHRQEYFKHPARRQMARDQKIFAVRKDGSRFAAEVVLSPVDTAQGVYALAIVRDITERLGLEEERNQLKVQLERQQERERIGMDLHDGVMQEVYAVGLTLELALVELDEDVDTARRSVERAIEQLHDVIRDIRSYIFDLRPRQFTGNLATALSDLAREFEQNSQVHTTATIAGELPYLVMEQSIALYHIAHEALSNVQKHAGATSAAIHLRCEPRCVELEVRDDGKGFDVRRDLPERHRGMRNMQARANAIGADFRVESSPGDGAAIRVLLMVTPQSRAQAGRSALQAS